jgi:hypothetical protein
MQRAQAIILRKDVFLECAQCFWTLSLAGQIIQSPSVLSFPSGRQAQENPPLHMRSHIGLMRCSTLALHLSLDGGTDPSLKTSFLPLFMIYPIDIPHLKLPWGTLLRTTHHFDILKIIVEFFNPFSETHL